MPEILIGKNLALESLQKAPLSPASRMIAKLAIDSVPVVDAEPVRHGRWIERECYSVHGEEHADYECSHCRSIIERKKFCVPPWCQWCGTKMDGGADNG